MDFLARYRLGECEQVWQELVALDSAVCEEPLHTVALEVARETMLRVKHNLHLIIPRLKQMGYQFIGGMEVQATAEQAATDLRLVPVIPPPPTHIHERIAELERIGGTLPLSLRTFYEHIGAVNLIGSMPSWENLKPAGMGDMPRFLCDHPNFDWNNYSLDLGLDPLFIWPIDVSILMLGELAEMAEAQGDQLFPFEVYIAPDSYSKYDQGGSGPYRIDLPASSADALVRNEWHDTEFVNYLRLCFRWGCMPGLERADVPPLDDIATLTKDLLPI